MKIVFRYIFAAAVLLSALSCRRTPLPDSPYVDGGGLLVPITFSATGAGMRLDASKAGASLKNPNDFLSAVDSFAVFGTWTVDNGTSANIFTKQAVGGTWNSTTNQFDCNYSPLRY